VTQPLRLKCDILSPPGIEPPTFPFGFKPLLFQNATFVPLRLGPPGLGPGMVGAGGMFGGMDGMGSADGYGVVALQKPHPEVGLHTMNPVDPQLKSVEPRERVRRAWFQPLNPAMCDILVSSLCFSNANCTATPSSPSRTKTSPRSQEHLAGAGVAGVAAVSSCRTTAREGTGECPRCNRRTSRP
jgi:hypothetical protein